jgi:AcrR family transcriptional regulator
VAHPTRSPKGAARREQILQTAMEGLAADGYRNTSIRGIGRVLGLEPAHILYYFDSREELLQKVIERWDEDAMAHLGTQSGPDEALDSYVETIRHNLQIPGIVHLYLTFAAEAVHPDHSSHEFFRQRFERVRAILEEGIRFEQASGRIEPGLDAGLESRKLVALADGLQLQALIEPGIDAPADLEAAVAELRGEA